MLTTPAEDSNFSVDDMIFIYSTDEYQISVYPIKGPRPTCGQLTRIISISNGVLKLEDRIENMRKKIVTHPHEICVEIAK